MKSGIFKDCIFRFRSTESLLGFNELKNTEIYFCPFDKEDDITEGELNLYWQADEILWDNFFAHYFLVFMANYMIILYSSPDERKIPGDIHWYQDRTVYKGLERQIEEFLCNDVVKAVKKRALWNNHRVDADEMKLYLNLIHIFAFDIMTRNTSSIGELDYANISSKFVEELGNINVLDEEKIKNISKLLYKTFECIKKKIPAENFPDWYRWLCVDFPDAYFDSLKTVLFPKWYMASFCNSCTEPRQWNDYTNNHKGVCLIFKTYPCENAESETGIRLRTCHEYSSSKGCIYNYHIEPLMDVKYVDEFPYVNFFENLGTFPRSMLDNWLHDRNGNKSSYYALYNDNKQRNWRKAYWQEYEYLVTYKSNAWNNQEEKRVILEESIFENYSNKEKRKIKYKFEDLQGIIWGLYTSESDKEKIRNIVEELCKENNRTDFKYYQLEVDHKTRKFVVEQEIKLMNY